MSYDFKRAPTNAHPPIKPNKRFTQLPDKKLDLLASLSPTRAEIWDILLDVPEFDDERDVLQHARSLAFSGWPVEYDTARMQIWIRRDAWKQIRPIILAHHDARADRPHDPRKYEPGVYDIRDWRDARSEP